jgi:hypothetical protein
MSGLLVLVTGTGRSGTSTIAGTLHHLGLSVPGPYLGANESNPKGFFESRWAVKFHKKITAAAHINDFDSRPDAFERAQSAVTPKLRAQLVEFLGRHAGESAQVVVKDPRSVWAQALWKECAAEVGLDIRYLSMLRHPAEVVGSRTTYYANTEDELKRRSYGTFNVARWVNSSLISERATRGETRTFVHYTDLLEDWRTAIARVRDELGIVLNDSLAPGSPHPVDEFIDPDLRRHQVTWDELEIPAELEGLAQQVWDHLCVLGRSGGVDAEASAHLDELGAHYRRLLSDAVAVSHDALEEVRDEARLAGARDEAARLAEHAAHKTAGRSLDERPVKDVGGRDLLRVAGRRVVRKLRP